MTEATTKLAQVLASIENIRSKGRGVKPIPVSAPPATVIPARPTRASLRERITPNGTAGTSS